MKHSFKKIEHLKSRVIMDAIFAEGIIIKKYPFILKYMPYKFKDEAQLKVVISIPKRRINKAVNRNRIRRQVKEAFRLRKEDLKVNLKEANLSLALFFIYTGKENPTYSSIEAKIELILKELSTTCKAKIENTVVAE